MRGYIVIMIFVRADGNYTLFKMSTHASFKHKCYVVKDTLCDITSMFFCAYDSTIQVASFLHFSAIFLCHLFLAVYALLYIFTSR